MQYTVKYMNKLLKELNPSVPAEHVDAKSDEDSIVEEESKALWQQIQM